MRTVLEISIIYTDEHLIQLQITASNGIFSGQTKTYTYDGFRSEFAEVIRGFPSRSNDSREYEIGTIDTNHDDGGAAFRLYCLNSLGSSIISRPESG